MDVLFMIFLSLFVAVVIYQCYSGTGSDSRSQHDWRASLPHDDGVARRDDDWLQQKQDPFDDWKPAEPVSMHVDSGWTCGNQGYGYYSGGIRIDD